MLCLIGLSIAGSMCKICTYCRFLKFFLSEHIPDMLCNDRTLPAKQFGHLFLSKPKAFAFKPNSYFPVVYRVVDDKFAHSSVSHKM